MRSGYQNPSIARVKASATAARVFMPERLQYCLKSRCCSAVSRILICFTFGEFSCCSSFAKSILILSISSQRRQQSRFHILHCFALPGWPASAESLPRLVLANFRGRFCNHEAVLKKTFVLWYVSQDFANSPLFNSTAESRLINVDRNQDCRNCTPDFPTS